MTRFFFGLLTAVFFVSTFPAHAETPLRISAYDSLIGRGSLGEVVRKKLEETTDCRVQFQVAGDAVQMVSRFEIDRRRFEKTKKISVLPHLLMGLDRELWARVAAQAKEFVPFDYGVLAWIVDSKMITPAQEKALATSEGLLDPSLKRQLILMDPRTSTPGLAFFTWVLQDRKSVEKASEFWGKLRTQWLTLAPGWSSGCGLFLRKQAPIVWSYTSSQAYHEMHGEAPGRYRAVLFAEGNPIQTEGVAEVKGAFSEAELGCAKKWVEILLSEEVQKQIPTTQWMLPMSQAVELPESFRKLPKPARLLTPSIDQKVLKDAFLGWNWALHATQ